MKKGIFIAGLMFCVSMAAMAQKDGKTKFSVGGELGFASGTFGDNWSLGIGGNAMAEHFFKEQISGNVSVGFNTYFGKKTPILGTRNDNFNIIPIRVGANYWLGDSFHAGAQTGVAFLSGGAKLFSVKADGAAFAFSPLVGYSFKTNKGSSLDVTVKYDVYVNSSTFTSPALRLSYIF